MLPASQTREHIHRHWLRDEKSRIFELHSLALCRKFAFVCRAESEVRYQKQDITADRPSRQIGFFIQKAKGNKRGEAANKSALTISIKANPALADLLDLYCAQRHAYYE
jgi:hypothetical protein